MLVLTRKRNESIVIGTDVTVQVVEIQGDKVRIGIEAPHEVPLHRREVFEAISRDRGPFPETRRVPVELLRRVIGRLADLGTSDATATLDAFELSKIINPPSERKDSR